MSSRGVTDACGLCRRLRSSPMTHRQELALLTTFFEDGLKNSMSLNSIIDATQGSSIAPAKGKLGVMVPGMGAVATTFMAGVEAVRRGIAEPIGSLTQMGTGRLGKRTEGRSPKIKDFCPLANLKGIVFTGWDILQ